MDHIFNFYNNGVLLQCDQIDFCVKIKLMFTNMLSNLSSPEDLAKNKKCADIFKKCYPRCLTCSMRSFGERHAGICPVCANKLIGNNHHIYLSFDIIGLYIKLVLTQHINWQRITITHDCEQIIDRLSLLKDRYFHDALIIFMIAIFDNGSSIHVLNNDVIMYIFQFIY